MRLTRKEGKIASSWSGKLVVTRGDDGKHDFGITLPSGIIDASRVSVYDGTGPTGFPGTVAVDDISAWMEQRKQAGFSFTHSRL